MGEGQASIYFSASTLQPSEHPHASSSRAALVQHIADRVVALGSGRLRIGIDGPTAAGKSTFGHELAEQVSGAGRQVLRASLDDFKKPWRERNLYDRESGEGYYRNAFDYQAVRGLLLDPAGSRGSGEVVLCSIDPLTQTDHTSIVARAGLDAVLIVDGVFAFRPEINDYWDLRIWLRVGPETSLRRGAERDEYWAGSAAETIHRDRYAVAERFYVEEVDPVRLADVIVDNSDFARPLIAQTG